MNGEMSQQEKLTWYIAVWVTLTAVAVFYQLWKTGTL